MNKLATITVNDSAVFLDCAKGSAKLSLPPCDASALGNWSAVCNAVEDLLVLAKPQKARLVLIIPSGDPANSELTAADEIRLATGVVDVSWSTAAGKVANLITRPNFELTERSGWAVFGSGRNKQVAKLELQPGSLTLAWNGGRITQQVPSHPRLLTPDFAGLADALIRAKRFLNVPHGVMVEVLGSTSFNQLEKQVVAEAVLESKLTTSMKWRDHSVQPENTKEGTWFWAVSGAAFALSALELIPIPLGWVIALTAIGFASAHLYWWQRDHREKMGRLSKLLVPRGLN